MKKTRAILLTIILITITFASCNLDGTAGIFRQVSQSKAPLSIRYKQLLGKTTLPDELYFRTVEGIERVTATRAKTTLVSSTYQNIIQAASLYNTHILYITNNDAERTANSVNVIDTTDPSFAKTSSTVTPASITSELAIKNLYANSMVLVSGKDVVGNKVFEMLEYDGTNFTIQVASFTPGVGYDVENVIQQSSKEQDSAEPMIISFVNADNDRIHSLVKPSTSLGTQDVRIANFVHIDPSNIFVLSTDGNLYHVDGSATWTLIGSSSRSYEPNAFALAVDDGTHYHLITKPSSKTAALHVFTILKTSLSASVGAGADIKSGYAGELSLATIVSSQVKSTVALSTDLLVATDESGMFDITILHADANKDIATNGYSSTPENYTL